jgi:hypothetical protein
MCITDYDHIEDLGEERNPLSSSSDSKIGIAPFTSIPTPDHSSLFLLVGTEGIPESKKIDLRRTQESDAAPMAQKPGCGC